MSRRQKRVNEIKPFFSLLIFILTLFSVVFLKMEAVRMGYIVLKQSRELKNTQDQKRQLDLQWAEATRPERVRHLAVTQLTLNEAKRGQIIQLTGSKIAIRQ